MLNHRLAGGSWSLFVAAGSVTLIAACQSMPTLDSMAPPRTERAQPDGLLGRVAADERIGPTMMDLAQIQAEVEAFADRYVVQLSQATDQVSRKNPEFRTRLHAVKLSVARGAYTIASGPNPVVSLLDMIVQATLVRTSIEHNLARSLPGDTGDNLLLVITKLHDEAWALGERVLPAEDLADLRSVIDSWIDQNPGQVYVAGIRLSDFARLRPIDERERPSNIFGWLRLDPFASIDPATRELEQSRLFAERVFYYLQRMPQLVSWQSETLYYELAGAQETQQVLAALQDMASASQHMSDTVARLPAQLQERLAQGEQSVREIVDEMNSSMEAANTALTRVDETAGNLRGLVDDVGKAGQAWEVTVRALNELLVKLDSVSEPSSREPVSLRDVTAVFQDAKSIAVELRQLINDVKVMTEDGSLGRSIATSTAEVRKDVQITLITSTICAAVVVLTIIVGAITYRAWVSRWRHRNTVLR